MKKLYEKNELAFSYLLGADLVSGKDNAAVLHAFMPINRWLLIHRRTMR